MCHALASCATTAQEKGDKEAHCVRGTRAFQLAGWTKRFDFGRIRLSPKADDNRLRVAGGGGIAHDEPLLPKPRGPVAD